MYWSSKKLPDSLDVTDITIALARYNRLCLFHLDSCNKVYTFSVHSTIFPSPQDVRSLSNRGTCQDVTKKIGRFPQRWTIKHNILLNLNGTWLNETRDISQTIVYSCNDTAIGPSLDPTVILATIIKQIPSRRLEPNHLSSWYPPLWTTSTKNNQSIMRRRMSSNVFLKRWILLVSYTHQHGYFRSYLWGSQG